MKALTTILATLALTTAFTFAEDEVKPAKPGSPGAKPADTTATGAVAPADAAPAGVVKAKPGSPGAKPAPADAAAPGKAKRDPAEMFKKLDGNSDNSISLEEMKDSPMGKKDATKAEETFKKMDKDSDGKVTMEEWKAAHEGHGNKKAAK